MGRTIPLGTIPRTNILPSAVYRMKVLSLEETTSKENEAEGKKAKLMYVLKLQVVEPKSHKGMPYTHNFCVGNEDDPDAELLETWHSTMGGKGLAKFSDKTGIPFGDEEDSESFCKQVSGVELLTTIVEKTNDGKKDSRRKGLPENDITAFWALGEKEPGLIDETATTAKVGRLAGKPATAAQPKEAPSEEVTCTVCKKRIKKTELKGHVDKHMADLAKQTGTGSTDDGEE